MQRASYMVLAPLLDPLFHPNTIGFRPGPNGGHLRALALAEAMAVSHDRLVWVIADLKDAFLHVPVPRLLDVLRKRLPDDDLINFLGRTLPSRKLKGIRQGGAGRCRRSC